MSKLSIFCTLIFLQLIAYAIYQVAGVDEDLVIPPLARTLVQINNTLESKANLQIHCKDKNEDFGVHQVPYHQTYEFSFVRNKFGRSLYFCGFVFKNELHWFDIYVNSRDYTVCGMRCRWIVKESGPCLLDTYTGDNCYPWNKD